MKKSKKIMNYNLESPTPFIKSYTKKHNHIINKFTDLMFSDGTTTSSNEFKSLPTLTQKLIWELSLYRLEHGPNVYL